MLERPRTAIWRVRLTTHWPVAFVLFAALLAGLVLGNDYGMSWDEYRNADVGADALQAYAGSDAYFKDDSLADHGPAYFMIQSMTSGAITKLLPGWRPADARHLTNYITFLAGALCFYILCLRWMKRDTAAVLTAVLVTQPLLLGNAFVNQKDIPFVTFFLATLVIGLAASDHWRVSRRSGAAGALTDERQTPGELKLRIRAEWDSLRIGVMFVLCAIGLAALILTVDLLVIGTLHRWGQSMVVAAYNGEAPATVQRLYALMASRAGETSLDLYLAKYDLYYGYMLLTVIPMLTLGYLMTVSLALPSIGRLWGFSRDVYRQPALLASAALLGLTICIRQVGAFVGVLVSLALVYRWRNRALFPLAVYWLISLVVTVATWPYLWVDPYSRLIGSLFLVADFPVHTTLFQGIKVRSGALPWNFFPTLAGLQLTETVVALFLLGLGVVIWKLAKREGNLLLYGLLGLWVGVPLVGLIFYGMPVYGIRHLLFVIPPLLLVAGIGLEACVKRLRWSWTQLVVYALVLLPGIWAIIQLHPYEYIYYNSFVGGVSGATGQYEIDRWCISYREAIEYANTVAEVGAVVVVPQQVNQIVPFARPDLRLLDARKGVVDADFVLSCTWRDEGRWDTRRFVPIYAVRRGRAVLTEVWQHRAD